MIVVDATVWVEGAFLDSVGEPIELAMQPHRVENVNATDVKLVGFECWIPKTACHMEQP